MEDKVRIFFTRDKGFLSKLIRWQTFGDYSHTGFLLPDGTIIESQYPDGVKHRFNRYGNNMDVYEIEGLTVEQSGDIIRNAKARIGRPYDFVAVIRFVSRKRSQTNRRDFCSEHVFEVCRDSLVNLLHPRTDSWRVHPSILPMSPILKIVHRGLRL